VHLVGFIIRIYHDARSSERQICQNYYCSVLISVDQGNQYYGPPRPILDQGHTLHVRARVYTKAESGHFEHLL